MTGYYAPPGGLPPQTSLMTGRAVFTELLLIHATDVLNCLLGIGVDVVLLRTDALMLVD